MNTNNEDLLLNEENKNNNEQPVNRNEQNNLNANQNVVDNNHRNEINELPYELNNNQQQVNEEQEKKKKKNEELAIVSNPNNNLINNAEKEVVKYDNVVDKKLSNVSKASGLNLKAYFVEENSKEIDEISKGRLGYTNFTFNGNIKEFYSKVYKHVLESNLIARQLASEDERGKYPTFKALSEQFEEFMKATGEELVQRGHLNKYVPFGGLSAKELKDIENSCLLNRPRSEKEAILKNVSNIKGKNFDEVVENGYQKAMETLTTLNGENYQKGQNPNKDKEYLDTSANLIKGMKALRESEKIWNTYIPDFSAPKWKEPIHKHPISNAFRAIKRGFGITFDSLVKFPLTNIGRAIKYPLDKVANIISVNYNQRKLENIVYSKGFSKEDLQNAMNSNEKTVLNVEDDVKAIDANFKENAAKIEQYKLEQNKDNVQKEEKKEVGFQNIQEQNPFRTEIVIHELDDNLINEDKVPEIKENQKVKENDLVINN